MQIDYALGKEESPDDYPTLTEKFEKGVEVIKTAFEEYDNPSVMWTGGKDSTLVLHLIHEVAEEHGYEMPTAIFIDHFQHFDAVHDFVDDWAEEWGIEVIIAKNDDVGQHADEPNDSVQVENLNETNQYEITERLEYEQDTFPFLLDTEVGNHLLKTVPFNQTVEEHGFDAVFSGVRWDEQEARSDETFFSPRHDEEKYPKHMRVHPILQFDEGDVWDATWQVIAPEMVETYPQGYVPDTKTDLPGDLTPTDLPVSPKYFEGYRSLGSEISTDKSDTKPAWKQDLDTEERAGRAQDKEGVMKRLRDLGYM